MATQERRVGTCHMCGRDVYVGGEEGRVTCEGCQLPTDNCTCQAQAAATA